MSRLSPNARESDSDILAFRIHRVIGDVVGHGVRVERRLL